MNASFWLTALKRLLQLPRHSIAARRNRRFRTEKTEALELRVLLAAPTNLGQIEGTTYQDANGNGTFDGGEPVLSNSMDGVVVHLFQDGGNGVFESAGMGGTAGGDDIFLSTANPDVSGEYTFASLTAGTYFVEQPLPAGFMQQSGGSVSGPIVISAADAQGTPGITIDDFSDPGSGGQISSTGVTNPHFTSAAVSAIGGERDMYAERTGGSLSVDLTANVIADNLAFSLGTATSGFGIVTWDGADASAGVATTGLGGVDLTNGGQSTGLMLNRGGDLAGSLTLTVHSGANSSTVTETVPALLPALDLIFIPFSSFTVASGSGASFGSAGAVELRIDGPSNFDAQIDLFQTHGPTVTTVNFANYQPMAVGGTIFADDNANGTFQSGTESTFSGVSVSLYRDDGTTPGVFDTGDTFLLTQNSVSGSYSFGNATTEQLFPDDYIVVLDASNFSGAGILFGMTSSTGNGVAPDPDDDTDNDDNGDHIAGPTSAVATQAVTLTNLGEPDVAVDGDDTNTNSTLDFGIFNSVDVAVSKTDNVDPVTAGSGTGNLTYTITATNNGPLDATGVEVTDALISSLPVGWTLDTATASGTTSFAAGTGVWTIGDLNSGATETLTLTLTIDVGAASGTTTNTVEVTAVDQIDSNSANNTASESTTVIYVVDISVAKADNFDPVTAGSGTGNLIYTVTATNSGPSHATGVTVTDGLIAALPTGWSLESAVGSGTTSFAGSTWSIGNLNSGATATLTITLTVGASAAALTTTNTVTVATVDQTESSTTNNTADEPTTVIRQVDIAVTKADNNDPVTAGSGAANLIYTVTATNNGPSDATGVSISDALLAALPSGWLLNTVSGSGATTFSGSTWTIGDLAAGDTESLTVTITVGSTAAAGTTTNTASVLSVNESDTDSGNDSAIEDTVVNRRVDIAVVKSDSADPITAGSGTGNLVYTLTTSNNGPSAASGVQVTDALIAALPGGWVLESSSATSGTFTAGTGIWDIGDLASGDSETLTLTLTVEASAAEGVTTNTADVTGLNETDTDTGNNTNSETTTVIRRVDIVVSKSDSADPVTAGSGNGNLTYTVTAENLGPSDATGVAVTDALIAALPVEWSFESAATSGTTTFDNSSGIWTIGNLSSGATATLSITLTIGGDAAAGTITNTAELTAVNETDTNSSNNSDDEDTTINRIVDIAVTKTDNSDPIIAGSGVGNLIYTVTATNNGPSNATGVSVQDVLTTTLPIGWTLTNSSVTAGSFGGAGVWTIGSLNSGATESLTLTLTVDASAAAGTTTNTATVTGVNETDSDNTNDSISEDTTVIRRVDIAVSKSDNADPIVAGSGFGNLVYTLTATNLGPSHATSVTVTDALVASLPAGFVLESAAGTGGSSFDSSNGLWTIGNLNAGDGRTLTLTLTVDPSAAESTITNTAVVSSVTETDTDPSNDTIDESTTIVRRVDVAVTKSDNNDPIIAGSGIGNLVYVIVAENTGPSDASGVLVTDGFIAALPTGFTVESVSSSGSSSFDTTSGVWNIGALAAGDARTLTVSITVDLTASDGTVTNVATISGLNETDTDPTNNTATETTTIGRLVDIAVTKSDAVDPVIAGSGPGNLVYIITAENFGPSDATGVEITDAFLTSLPAGISLDSASPSGGTSFDSPTGRWLIGPLSSGDSQTLTVTLTADQSTAAGPISNTVTLTAVNETDLDPTNNTDTEVTTITRSADLVVTKTDVIDPIRSPDQIQYTISVTNNGPSSATGVVISDNLSSLVSFNSVTASQGSASESNGVVTALPGEIGAGSVATITIVVDIDLPSGGVVNNIATATATETDPDPGNNMDDESTTVEPAFSSISGFVYLDLNNDGVFDSTEDGIPNTPVVLFGRETGSGRDIVRVNRTDAAGRFSFDQLLPGEYRWIEIQPKNVSDGIDSPIQTAAVSIVDTNSGLDGDGFATSLLLGDQLDIGNFGNTPLDESKITFLASNQQIDQELFRQQSVTGTGRIDGRVAVDVNLNGGLDSADRGLGGVTVTLAGIDSSSNTVLIRRTTASDGSFSFTNLAAGTYSVIETQPLGFSDSNEQNAGMLMPLFVADDAFAAIVLAPGGTGSGLNFLETEGNAVVAPVIVPVLESTVIHSTSQPVLSWNAASDAVAYDIWLSQIGHGLVYRNRNVSGTSIQIPVDLALDDHRFWVRSIDANGVASAWSEPSDFIVSTAPEFPDLPASTIDSTPEFSWTTVPGASSYDLMLYDSRGNLVLNETQLTETRFSVSNPLNEDTYRLWVRARSADAIGQWSNAGYVSVTGAPDTLVPVGGSTLAPTLLEWTDSGAETYRVWINNVTTAPTVVAVKEVTGTSLLWTDELAEGKYRFWVQGRDSANNLTAWSAPRTFFITARASNLTPTGSHSGDPTFAWDAVAGAISYDLWVSDASGLVAREQHVYGTSHSFGHSFSDGDYRFWVKPHGAAGNGKWSAAAAFTNGGHAAPVPISPTGLTSGQSLTFEWTAVSGAASYELWVNHQGVTNRIIHETALASNAFTSAANLAPGIYRFWVRAIGNDGQHSSWSRAVRFVIS